MTRKTLIGVVFGLALAGAAAVPASADVDIDININYGGFYGQNISCRTGGLIVERRFNHVKALDCNGSRYDYSGKRNGKWYTIGVSAYTGRISEIRRWYR